MSAPVVIGKQGAIKKRAKRDYDGFPGVTDVVALLGLKTQALMWWAAGESAYAAVELKRQGVSDEEAVARARKAHAVTRGKAADAGTLCHEMIAEYLTSGVVPSAPSPWDDEPEDETRRKARLAFLKFLEWWPTSGLEVEAVEMPLIDAKLGYGGTLDNLFRRKADGARILGDIKTGGIYDEVVVQLGGYSMLLRAHDMPPDEAVVIHVPVNDEPLRAIPVSREQLEHGRAVFGCLLMIHGARKSLALNASTKGVP